MVTSPDNSPEEVFTAEEMDILHEVMNIAFGSAAADLAEAIDIYVVLSVPTVRVMRAGLLPDFIRDEIRGSEKISIVEQNFFSKFKGLALLIFPSGVGKSLIALLEDEVDSSSFESDPMDALERETLMEVGNILVGACVGKVAELLGDRVVYAPPKVIVENISQKAISNDVFDPEKLAIILQTVFHFNDQDVGGSLFLICSHESIEWLKQALYEFMKQYE